jgi:hypothetical protein
MRWSLPSLTLVFAILHATIARAEEPAVAPAPACEAAWRSAPHDKDENQLSSRAATRAILKRFSHACRASFPLLAAAAERASRVGRTRRSAILALAARDACPPVLSASSADDLRDACPPPDPGVAPLLWKQLDAGTYAFYLSLRHAGISMELLQELLLQASLHPERG